MTFFAALLAAASHALRGPSLLPVLGYELPEGFPFDDKYFDRIDEEDYPFIRKPTDINWNDPNPIPADYDPESDPDVIAWREAQKPPVMPNAVFVSEAEELKLPRFHFFYIKNCKYSDAALAAFKEFQETNADSPIPVYYTDCGRWDQFCQLEQVGVDRAPVMTYYAPNNYKVVAAVEQLNASEQFAKFWEDVRRGDTYSIEAHPSSSSFCDQWAGVLKCNYSAAAPQFTSQEQFDRHVNNSLFVVQKATSYNFDQCQKHRIFIYGNDDSLNDLMSLWKNSLSTSQKDFGTMVCLLDYQVYGPFAYMTWGITERDLPAVITRDGIVLPASPADVFE